MKVLVGIMIGLAILGVIVLAVLASVIAVNISEYFMKD